MAPGQPAPHKTGGRCFVANALETFFSVIWGAVLMALAMVGVSASVWYSMRRMEAARRGGTEQRFAQRATWVLIAVGAAIIAEGLALSVITGRWLVLTPTACVGLLIATSGVRASRRLRRTADATRQSRSPNSL